MRRCGYANIPASFLRVVDQRAHLEFHLYHLLLWALTSEPPVLLRGLWDVCPKAQQSSCQLPKVIPVTAGPARRRRPRRTQVRQIGMFYRCSWLCAAQHSRLCKSLKSLGCCFVWVPSASVLGFVFLGIRRLHVILGCRSATRSWECWIMDTCRYIDGTWCCQSVTCRERAGGRFFSFRSRVSIDSEARSVAGMGGFDEIR